jgi:hypothetical protein
MVAPPLSLSEQAFRLLKFYEDDETKPHQKLAHAAFRASSHADELTNNHKYGRIGDDQAHKIRDAHKEAHDKHVQAAAALYKAGHYGTSRDHQSLAVQHAKHAHHFHEIHKKHGEKPAKAAGESTEPRISPHMAEQYRLMGLTHYPTLFESTTLEDLEEYELIMGSWRQQQRALMGLERRPGLGEQDSDGKKYVNFQVLKDQAQRASMRAFENPSSDRHREAAEAHRVASRNATNEPDRIEHDRMVSYHDVHASRSPQLKYAEVQKKVNSPEYKVAGEAVDDYSEATGVPDAVKRPTIKLKTKRCKCGSSLSKYIPGTTVCDTCADKSEAAGVPKAVKTLARDIEKKQSGKGGTKKYSPSKAYATAWAIACKHGKVGSGHCSRPPSGYLK